MPIFEFSCDKCGQIFEEITSSTELSPQCPHCGANATHKLMSACARHRSSGAPDYPASSSSGGGCAGCSGGNCASCGH